MLHRATPEMMRLRRSTVEHPFAALKYRIFGHPRFLLRGLDWSPGRDQPRDHGLQPQAYVQPARRVPAASCARRLTAVLRSPSEPNKKAPPGVPERRFSRLLPAVS